MLVLLLATACSAACKTNLDCQLVGDCINGQCACDDAWIGENCDTLDERPGWLIYPNPHPVINSSTAWGASIYKDANNKYHVFEDVVCDNMTDMHINNAVIAHAISDNIQGPYKFLDISLPPTSWNPHLSQAPDGTFLLYHNIIAPFNWPICTGLGLPQAQYSFMDSSVGQTEWSTLAVAASSSLSGPWKIYKLTPDLGPFYHYENPSALIFENGTVLLALRANMKLPNITSPYDERLVVMKANHWSGPYSLVGNVPMFDNIGEDPFIWQSKRGFHIVYHAMWKPNDGYVDVGGYTYSTDGLIWHHAPKPIYTTSVPLQDIGNEVYFRRERPGFYIENGKLAYLITGVQKIRKIGQPSFTALNPVG